MGTRLQDAHVVRRIKARVRALLSQFRYRLDTNFAKIDRIEHVGLEEFKSQIMNYHFHGKTIQEWALITETAGIDKIIDIMGLGN